QAKRHAQIRCYDQLNQFNQSTLSASGGLGHNIHHVRPNQGIHPELRSSASAQDLSDHSTTVPISSPLHTRRMLPRVVSLKTRMGSRFSRQSVTAVESMTPMRSARKRS